MLAPCRRPRRGSSACCAVRGGRRTSRRCRLARARRAAAAARRLGRSGCGCGSIDVVSGETLKNQRTKRSIRAANGDMSKSPEMTRYVPRARRRRSGRVRARSRRTLPTARRPAPLTAPNARLPARFLQPSGRTVAWHRRGLAQSRDGSGRPHGARVFMLIRIGFDIELSVATPMALIYLLRVHPSRRDDLLAPENLLDQRRPGARGVHRQLRQPLRPGQRAGRHGHGAAHQRRR